MCAESDLTFTAIVSLLRIVLLLQLVSLHPSSSVPPAPVPECSLPPQTPPGLSIHREQQLSPVCQPCTDGARSATSQGLSPTFHTDSLQFPVSGTCFQVLQGWHPYLSFYFHLRCPHTGGPPCLVENSHILSLPSDCWDYRYSPPQSLPSF